MVKVHPDSYCNEHNWSCLVAEDGFDNIKVRTTIMTIY